MSAIGKEVRLSRIINQKSGRTLIIPFDHGIPYGPVKGIEDIRRTVHLVAEGGASAIVINPGIVGVCLPDYKNRCGTIVKLTNRITESNQFLISTVEDALKMGADGVSYEIKVGSRFEEGLLNNARLVLSSSNEWGMPVVVMVYSTEEYSKTHDSTECVKICARAGAEIGADIVKVAYTGSMDSFKEVVKGCPKPVVCAGGSKQDSAEKLFEMVKNVLEAGAIGVAIGRNVWQYKDPMKMTHVLSMIVHENASIEKALKELRA